ncbi:hypothetical protein ACE1AT_14395, partial [Pelatocladus sp. BLCC-F211]|uniref:hypothetical protein n=1 Tax=Pelatocladus sp. BLCC-F211 TaxID=3342752 RepID=UPI0035BAFACC
AVSKALSTIPDSTTGEISENSLSCIQHQCIQGITLTLPDFGLNRTVLHPLAPKVNNLAQWIHNCRG